MKKEHMLKNLENKILKVGLFVAHPDDCVIYGWSIIKYFKKWQWTIVYLTYNNNDARAIEINNFWQEQNVNTKFLGFEDHHRDLDQNKLITFNEDDAKKTIKEIGKNFDIIVSHNSKGEYGHIHHKLVNSAVNELKIPKIYFGDNEQYNFVISSNNNLDLKKLPLHRKVIEMFDYKNNVKYFITKEVNDIGI